MSISEREAGLLALESVKTPGEYERGRLLSSGIEFHAQFRKVE